MARPWWMALLALVACAAEATPEDCACGADQLCELDGADALCRQPPASCDSALEACDASDACKDELCGGPDWATFVLACESTGTTWFGCE